MIHKQRGLGADQLIMIEGQKLRDTRGLYVGSGLGQKSWALVT